MRSSAAGAPGHPVHSAHGGNSSVKAFVENLTGGAHENCHLFFLTDVDLGFPGPYLK